ncbi:MAG: DNA-3-methyladenine glycosylase [Rhodothermales bacterium]
MQPLPRSYFAQPTLDVAADLLGKLLVRERDGGTRLVGRIVETEAYTRDDPAMHGWKAVFDGGGLVLPQGRAADLFAAPGTAYVYRIYHTNWLLNVVTEPEGTAGAVLIRGIEPLEGVDAMQANRPPTLKRARDLTNGPGKLTQALDIADGAFHGTDLTTPPLYFADDSQPPPAVETSSRIGISRGIDRMYRFYVPRHPFVSPGLPSDIKLARMTKRRG